jgi:TonB family protein
MSSPRHPCKSLFLIAVYALLAGCATPERYSSTYSVGDSGEVDARAAESAVARSFAASFAGTFDKPVRLIRAPQPKMPPDDIDSGVGGRVVVRIVFGESGRVDSLTPVSSSKASLNQAVLQAVAQWQIEPVTLDGKPQKMTIQAPFEFRAER